MSCSYDEAVQRLLWLGHEGRTLKWDLRNVGAVLERLGHPERKVPSVHLAGTNGKGSVAAMTAAILRAAGYRTGLYTSPHLVRINERIALNGEPIADTDFAAAFNAVAVAIEELLARGALPHHPSYFESLTAMALWHFARAGVDIAVLEVGLGGRLDATNVVTPEVAVITSIDFDHERYLGHAIEQIAAEKAGIIKPDVPVINAAAHPRARQVVAARAREAGAPVVDVSSCYRAAGQRSLDWGRYHFTLHADNGWSLALAPALRGAFQVENARVAVAAARTLDGRDWSISDQAIAEGVARVEWPGRLELIRRSPPVFLDGAHNPAAARALARFWDEHAAGRPVHLVYGTLRDKALDEILETLFPRAASVTATEPPSPRAASAQGVARLGGAHNAGVRAEPDLRRAVSGALEQAGRDGIVFVTGSLFLVGECRRLLLAEQGAAPQAQPVRAPRPLPSRLPA